MPEAAPNAGLSSKSSRRSIEHDALPDITISLASISLQVNPHKWKKYSLSDADTSDRTNTAAAFEFLREIEARKRDEAEADDAMDDEEAAAAAADGKIVFKNRRRIADGSSSAVAKFNQSAHLKPIVESGNAEENAEKAQLKGSKVVMPEYVIGQKVAAREKKGKLAAGSSKTSSSSASSASQLKLGHLFEEEEDWIRLRLE